ncbi:MAG: GNAT family N-acetyltransferase [Alphaproteobacteria bacterium]|nr:MAG: GNAT family N-acetyltransferase [Alphaproteobacteria bacterium]
MRSEAARATGRRPVLRLAGVADLPACARIVNDYIDETEWLPRVHSREQVAGFFTPTLLASRALWLAELDGDIVGYMSVAPTGMVHALYLAPNARGAGLGAMLIDRAKQDHPERVELTVFEPNLAARRFYAREGFVEVPEGRRVDTEEGIPTLLMRWRGRQ